jgi:hypothetical protein
VTLFLAGGTLVQPYGLTLDGSGNVYVADSGNRLIRKVTSGGVVSTLAGAGGSTFSYPVGVAIDSSGNVYVTDRSANLIRKVTPGGTVSTYAGLSGSGTVDGNLATAEFKNPAGLAIDGSGNLFLTDSNQIVRKISSGGTVTSLAGSTTQPGSTDGTGNTALFSFAGSTPAGIAVDHSGNLFVADVGNDTIREGVASSAIPPTIGTQPQSQSVNPGAMATFSVVLAGTGPFTYQWNASGGAIIGATNPTYTTGAAGSYQVVVIGAGGTVFSNFASLSVNATAAPPVFTTPPASQTVTAGTTVTFSPVASNSPTYQWSFNGAVLQSDTVGVLTLSTVSAASAGTYTVTATNSGGTVSTTAVLTVVTPPAITAQPQNLTVLAGGNASFQVTATGTGPLTYQWRKNGGAINGATSASLALTSVSADDAASYAVMVTNAQGSVTSTGASLTVTVPSGPVTPSISVQPAAQSVTVGTTVSFTVAATGTAPLTFQWRLNGAALSGATGSTLTLASPQAADAGAYTVTVSNGAGSVLSNAATLTVTSSPDPGRLVNLSILSTIQSTLSMGLVIGGGAAGASENLLIRAVGPSIGPTTDFKVPGVMADPTLTVIQQTARTTLATNAGWGTPVSNVALVRAAAAATGAFPLTDPNTLDSALVESLGAITGGYSIVVAGQSGDAGNVLTEIYDDTANYTSAVPRLVNLSCLTQIAPGGSLIVGFVIGGSTGEKLLIRVSGPTLAAFPYNIGGTMPDPELTISPLNSATVLAHNAGWNGDSGVAAAATAVGAFSFVSYNSLDSAVVYNFTQTGPYTVTVSSHSFVGGTVLVEIYEVP